MEHLVRDEFQSGGYVFASGAVEIARKQGFTRIAYLASNENPFPPSPLAVARAHDALLRANRYPDEKTDSLVAALTRRHGDYHFVTGVGMDGVIETMTRVLIDPGDTVVISTPTFSFYEIATRAQGGKVRHISRRSDYSIDPDAFVKEAEGAKIAFICSPNNPTGNTILPEVVAQILDDFEGIVFLDNAYVEFSRSDYLPLMKEHDNLVIGRTFSKAYSLAGLRVGYAAVPDWMESYYHRASTPFSLNSVSSAAAEGALEDEGHIERIIRHVEVWRDRFDQEIRFAKSPSGANFVLVDIAPMTGEEAVERLAAQGVIVRSCTSFPGLGNHYIRVSIGEDWENERLINALNAL